MLHRGRRSRALPPDSERTERVPRRLGGCVGRVQAGALPFLNMTKNCIYLIEHCSSKLVKIGITEDWQRRARQLKIGSKCKTIIAVTTDHNSTKEKELHLRLDTFRLPQSEWFHLDSDQIEALKREFKDYGAEIKWRPTKKQKPKRKPKLKNARLFFEEEIELWQNLFDKSPYIPTASYYADSVVLYSQKVRKYEGEFVLTPVGTITVCPNTQKPLYSFRKAHHPYGKSQEIVCDTEWEMHGLIEAMDGKMREQNDGLLLLPLGTKLKWRFGPPFSMEDLFDELGSYFPEAP